jgi:hypothetical protein
MLIASYFGVRRPVGAMVGCDLSQPAYIEFTLARTRRRAAANQSGDRSPHSKERRSPVLGLSAK